MRTMPTPGCLLVVAIVLLQSEGAVVSRSATKLYFVPSNARSGHVVATLPYTQGQLSRVLSSSANDVKADSFAVLSTGALIITSDVSALGGRSVSLTIQHSLPSESWLETVDVHIHDASQKINFRNAPYAGYVAENEPAGSSVGGLREMAESVRDLPYGCQLTIVPSADATTFDVARTGGNISIVTTAVLDREHKDTYHVTVRAQCPNGEDASAIVTIRVLDANDNAPEFDVQIYLGKVALDAAALTTVLRISAVDADSDDMLRYSLRDPATPFNIDSITGEIYVKTPGQLLMKTYELKAIATDNDRHTSAPASVRIEVYSPIEDSADGLPVLVRSRRAADRQERVFVARRSDTDDLFSVAADSNERYQLTDEDEAMGLTLSATGMISRESSHQWNETIDVFAFSVSVTKVDDTAYQSTLPVKVYLVSRGNYDPIFTNTPQPLWATVPQWIRPDTAVYTVQAIDADRAEVQYRLESGGEDRFTVDQDTGVVKVAGRKQYEEAAIYELAISAQVVGTARKAFTPAQVLSIAVDDKEPQFEQDPYVTDMSELTNAGDQVVQITGKSFQEIEIQYSLAPESTTVTTDDLPFRIDGNSGWLTLREGLTYTDDPHQYRMLVTAREPASGIESKVLVIVNLTPANRHNPYFALDVYEVRDVSEDVTTSEDIVSVTAIDLDYGLNGNVTFESSNENFSVSTTDNKHGIVHATRQLDYDFQPLHMYELTVTATDQGSPPRSGSVTVRLWMENSNDEAPVFDPPQQVMRVKEFSKQGLLVHVVQAYDPDGDNIRYKFTDRPSAGDTDTRQGKFALDRDTGFITLAEKLERPTPNTNLSITATDDGSCCQNSGTIHQTIGYIEVRIIGVNHPPQFAACPPRATPTVKENMEADTHVFDLRATDDDSGSNGEVVFSVLSYSHLSPKHFDVVQNGKEASLKTLRKFDREDPLEDALQDSGQVKYKVTVRIEDKGEPNKLSTTCFFFVVIQDVNDNAPRFDEESYETTIATDLPRGSRVLRVYAIDDDEGENAAVVYSIDADGQDQSCINCLAIDAESGWITVQSVVSTERQLTLTVKASDQGSPSQFSTVQVVVTVTTRTTDLPPTWDRPLLNVESIDDLTVEVAENTNANTALDRSFHAQYGDIDPLLYLLVKGRTPQENKGLRYFISPQVKVGANMTIRNLQLDYETVSQFSLKLRVSVPGVEGQSSDARLKVQVQDVNDNIPQWVGLDTNGKYPAAVSDTTEIGHPVLTVKAIDLDGTSPNRDVTYKWEDTCTDCEDFNLNSESGLITAARTYDRSVKKQYQLNVVAEDGAASVFETNGEHNTVKISVFVNVMGDTINPPYFERQLYQLSVAEGSPYGHTIGYVNATNPEAENSIAQYSFIEGNEDHVFGLDHINGRIFVMGELRYTTKSSYQLTYRVFDGGAMFNLTYVVITVMPSNLYPPVFEPLEYTISSSVDEDDSSNIKTLLATVTATDPGKLASETTSLRYSVAGHYIREQPDAFSIESDGSVYFRTMLDRDYPHGHANWQINVVATDATMNGGKAGYGVVNLRLIDSNDNAPVFDTCCLSGTVPEHSPSGTPVLTVITTDFDEGANAQVRYELVEPPTSSGADIFTIGQTSGVLTTTNVGRTALDRETQDSYDVVVRAYDNGVPRQETEQTLIVSVTDINDKSPVFPAPKSYTVEIPEEMSVGTPVTVIAAADEDTGRNAELTYRIVTGGRDQFYMDSIFVTGSGVIRINKRIDFEAQQSHVFSFTVRVEDPDSSHFDTADVTVNIVDINDNAPVFTRGDVAFTMREDRPADTDIATFTATDKDEGVNAEFEYFIDYRNTDQNKMFKIDKTTGDVQLRNQLDYEVETIHNVHILAIDKGVPPQTGTATLVVTVVDVNDNKPELPAQYNNVVVRQTTQRDALVASFRASDRDSVTNGPPFNFEWNCNAPECTDFRLDVIPDTTGQGNDEGRIIAARSGYSRSTLNRDKYLLPILIIDNPTSGAPKQTATVTMTITIEADIAPGTKYVTAYNYKRGFGDVAIGTVFAGDGEEVGKTYEFFDEQNDGFTLNTDTGELTMEQGVPKGEHLFTVKVTDSGGTIISTVIVNVVYLEEEQVMSSGSMRLSGITAEEFIRNPKNPDGLYQDSKYDKLRKKLAGLLGTDETNVLIFTVRDVSETGAKVKLVDVMYAAHGSPWYRPARMNGLVWSNKEAVESAMGVVTIVSSPVNECLDKPCWDSGCNSVLKTDDEPLVVNTGKTTLVGVKASYVATCECGATTFSDEPLSCGANACFNGGACVASWSGYSCACTEGFTGPRCQQLKLSFTGGGWAWFDPLSQCEDGKTSFEILTTGSNSLLLYNGPIDAADSPDFMSLELVDGYPILRVNLGEGEISLEVRGQQLNNGKWHSLEVFKDNRKFRLVIDHCKDSVISENIANSTDDRSGCEGEGEVPGEDFLLTVNTPLWLGGRVNATINTALQGGYVGCIKNLRHNGLLYDLHVGEVGESKNTQDGCPQEVGSCSGCPSNSTCVGSMTSEYTCTCNPGLRGAECDEEVSVKDFYQEDSAIEWELKAGFNDSLSSRHFDVQVMFRTRQSHGMVFSADSFSTLERLQIWIVATHLMVKCDLGSGDEDISLDYVNVSDGQWHVVRVTQYGNNLILRLDGGEGRNYAESPPRDDEHRLISLSGTRLFGAADVTYKKYVDTPTRTSVLIHSCVKDVRYNGAWFPMDRTENGASNAAAVAEVFSARSGCVSSGCMLVTCPAPQSCFDVWREHECRCPFGQMVAPSPEFCVVIVDCSIKRCDHGDCVIIDGNWHCNCHANWTGATCANEAPLEYTSSAKASTGMIVAIVLSLLALLIIILAVVIITRRRKPDLLLGVSPEDDVRENVGYYDEEGAGEEDMHAYDLSRLQKPIDGDTDSMIKPPLDNPAVQLDVPLTRAEPRTDPRPPLIPGGDNPNIGDFIDDRMRDADDDPSAPPGDSVHAYDYEGGDSEAGTLSSLQSSSSGDGDFDYLNDFGPRFKKLADLYGGGDSDDDEDENASSV